MAALLSSTSFSSLCVDSKASSSTTHLGFQNARLFSTNNFVTSREHCLVSAYRKQRSQGLPPGGYEMIDDDTGDRVIVLGLDEDEEPPDDEELQWDFVKVAKPGDIPERTWKRLLKSGQQPGGPAYSLDGSRSSLPKSKPSSSESKSSNSSSQEYSDTSASRSNSFFSRLKVQPLRSQTKFASVKEHRDAKQNKPVPKNEHLETSRFSEEDDDGRDKWSFEHEKLRVSDRSREDERAPRKKGLEASSLCVNSDSERFSRGEANEGRASINGTTSAKAEGFRLPSPIRDLESKGNLDSQNQRNFKEIVAEDFFSIKKFKNVRANDRIIQSLQFMDVRRPSQIQALSFEHILEGRSCILADQTGSGKTLAYLAPLFQRLLKEEEEGSSKSLGNKPRVLVMVPTSELAAQVLAVCRGLSKGGSPLKSMVATGGFRLKTQVESLDGCVDIVIATPGRFLQLVSSESLQLGNLRSIVLDEVDVLFDDPEFSETLQKIESLAPIKTQYIHVTATLPVDVCDAILEKHPTSVPLMGPGLHCTATGLQEVLVDCSGEGEEKTPETAYANKRKALLQLVEQQLVPKTIVFCNKIETCRKVENALKRADRKGARLLVLPYHAALSLEARQESMRQFAKADPAMAAFLICTDRASRGLDLVDVEHVVLFDFPRDPSEYVRRVGRTARAGGAGKAFVFVVGKQVSLARKIMVRNEKGHPIHTVPSHT